jgi:hypothetical protein
MKRFIVKVQRPLAGNDDSLLVYDKGQDMMEFVPAGSKVGKDLLRLMGPEFKIYIEAEFLKKEKKIMLLLDRVMPAQKW